MTTHVPTAPEEIADRLAIRGLIDAYAHVADPTASEPGQVLTGHAEHVEGFRGLSEYAATMHFNGQSSIEIDGDRATGERYCLAHHLAESEEGPTLLVLFIRYEDSFTRRDGTRRFAERRLLIDWSDRRPSLP